MTKQFGGIILQYVVRSCVENARQSQQLDCRQGTKSLPWSLEHGPVRAQVSTKTRRGELPVTAKCFQRHGRTSSHEEDARHTAYVYNQYGSTVLLRSRLVIL